MIRAARFRSAALLCSALLIAGCGNDEAQRQAAQAAAARAETEAAALMTHLDAAVASGRPDLARAFGEDLMARFPSTVAGRTLAPRLDELRTAAEAEAERRRLTGLWTYHAVNDEASGGTVFTAFIYAAQGKPGMPAVRLVLRRHPDWGQSAYLLITDGDFACQGKCPLQVTADGGEPQALVVSRAEGNVPPAVFIDDDSRFLALLRNARQIELRLDLAPARETRFVFDIGGFDPKRLAAPMPDSASTEPGAILPTRSID